MPSRARALIAIVVVVLAAVVVPAASARPTAKLRPIGAPSRALGHRASTRTVPEVVTATVVQTASDLSHALRTLRSLRFAGDKPVRHVPVIHVRANVRFQRFAGIGAALTDSSAWLIGTQLSPAARSSLMSRLFGAAGIRLSFLRLPMGSSDFSVAGLPYTYDDLPVGESDVALAHFSIGHDLAYVIPTLQQAVALNPQLEIMAIPWSAPAWMKANSALDNLGHAGALLPADYGPFAQYFVTFLRSYAASGIRIAAIAPQNEPGVPSSYPGMQLTQLTEADFITHYLRPALVSAALRPEIFGWDLSWGSLKATTPIIASTGNALSGVAWHCYFGSPTMMSGLHASVPALDQVVDECTTPAREDFPTPEEMISALRNWASAFAVWNLALDPAGGPVEAPNPSCTGCTGLVTIDPGTGSVSPSREYYQLGQVSKYVRPGAVRIGSDHFVSYRLTSRYQTTVTPGVDDVAFQNPDKTKVLVLYNNSGASTRVSVEWNKRYLTCRLPAQATTTLIWH